MKNIKQVVASVIEIAETTVSSIRGAYRSVGIFNKYAKLVKVLGANKELMSAIDDMLDSVVSVISAPETAIAVESIAGAVAPKVGQYADRVQAMVETIRPEAERLVEDIGADVDILAPFVDAQVKAVDVQAIKASVQRVSKLAAKDVEVLAANKDVEASVKHCTAAFAPVKDAVKAAVLAAKAPFQPQDRHGVISLNPDGVQPADEYDIENFQGCYPDMEVGDLMIPIWARSENCSDWSRCNNILGGERFPDMLPLAICEGKKDGDIVDIKVGKYMCHMVLVLHPSKYSTNGPF